MKRILYFAAATAITSLLSVAGCDGGDDGPNPGTGGQGGDAGGGAGGCGPDCASGRFIRLHYRLQGDGDVSTWGVHFFGTGVVTEPAWGSPQLFSEKDDFGGYTDILIDDTAATETSWIGLIPVQCDASANCTKDVETSVRWADLHPNADNERIHEAWITQGQAISREPPSSTGPAYKISHPNDFIDLGNGSVRLMFRVAMGSTGTVRYGTAPDMLDQSVTWTDSDDINARGLIIDGLTAGTTIHYQVSTTLVTDDEQFTDESEIMELTPIAVVPVVATADWANWGREGTMYQLIVRTFADGGSPTGTGTDADSGIDPAAKDGIGDLVGLRQKLPYLSDLGITSIWMTPVFAANSYHGYDTTDFYNIDPSVGSVKDFKDLTDAAHALDIKIIVDLVQNHVADVNPWFVAALDPSHADHAKYHDWFLWSDEYSNMFTDAHPFDPSAVIWSCKNYMCYHQIFGGQMPELNYRNPEVRTEMKNISKHWIDLGADGFRLDASKHIEQFDDNNQTDLALHGTHIWWKEFNAYVKRDVPRPAGSVPVLLAGENRWDDPAVATNMVPYAGDMDSQFDFPFRSILANFVSGQSGEPADLVKYFNDLRASSAATVNGGNVNHFYQRFLSNHDLERPATQFRDMAGEHLTAVLKQAATVIFTMPGMPVVYYGEELGKQGKRDKLAGAVAEGDWDRDELIREPMSWFQDLIFADERQSDDRILRHDIDFAATNDANAVTMADAGICMAPNPDYPFIKFMSESEPASVEAQMSDPESLYSHYKSLIQIRRTHHFITNSDVVAVKKQDTATWYEYSLTAGGQSLTVLLNRTATDQTLARTMVTDLLSGSNGPVFNVPAYGALILQVVNP
ncbi:alpha-amylase family glycosyl hydrolase [Chondromyces apiculatus]|uniref:Glycosyl hydrolase family 13 catalytic domain-containing protein n=1 Tax=Chondromyces apiculatus DSM 436 TaxID=1192034 RepID=A0A017TA31_9BACT|nr:alpha-amylase family glycosyl hydrolase [Chondromyces apiculatus]EYF06064.1 Hypothetical protein CAP_2254 [Chondromyces apiculatus DSM 436]